MPAPAHLSKCPLHPNLCPIQPHPDHKCFTHLFSKVTLEREITSCLTLLGCEKQQLEKTAPCFCVFGYMIPAFQKEQFKHEQIFKVQKQKKEATNITYLQSTKTTSKTILLLYNYFLLIWFSSGFFI